MLVAVAASNSTPAGPVAHPAARMGEVALLAAAVIAMTYGAVWRLRRCLVRRPDRATLWGQWYRWVQRGHLALWAVAAIVIALPCQWPQLIQVNWRLQNVPLLDDLVLLGTLLFPLAACWPAFYGFEHTVEKLVARREGRATPPWNLAAFISHETKQNLGIALAPLLLVMLVQDILRISLTDRNIEQYGWLFHISTLASLVLLLPFWLQRLWNAKPLPRGRLRRRLKATARRVDLRLREFLVWPTQHQIANAVVAGFFGPTRFVYFTDRLLDLLTEDELEAVLLHEAAHIRRRHLWLRMMLLLFPLAVWACIDAGRPQWSATLNQQWEMVGGISIITTVALPLAACLYAAVVLGATSRWLEHDADLFALSHQRRRPTEEATKETTGEAPLIAALQKLAAITPDASRPSWMHPSLHQRIDFLERVVCFPDVGERVQRILRGASWGLVATFAALLVTRLMRQ